MTHPTGLAWRIHRRLSLPLLGACALALSACGGGGTKGSGAGPGDGDDDAGTGNLDAGFGDPGGDSGGNPADNRVTKISVAPKQATLTLGSEAFPTQKFTVRTVPEDADDVPAAAWLADHHELGSIDPKTGVFTPSGAAGTLTVMASVGGLKATATLTLVVAATQEGDPEGSSMPGGAGGVGGVGGEGGGTAITDKPLRDALDTTPIEDAELSWLYPYDKTVWPRDLPAPLLQWSQGTHKAEAVHLHIEVGDAYRYDGYFGRPAALATGKPFEHLPIPQSVWRNALYSGAIMKVSLSIAASDGAGGYLAYAPAKQMTWNIAQGSLKGTVYYNSYGTQLAKNNNEAIGGDGRFGGATLAINGSSFDPMLVAGFDSDDGSGCRVCHTVSGDGATLIVQHENNTVSSRYDLKALDDGTQYPGADNGKFGWAALSPDGKVALGNAGPPGSNGQNVASLGETGLYRVSDGAVLTTNGLNGFVTKAAMPAFAPDGTKVAFNLYDGPGTSEISADGKSLVVMDFARSGSTYAFTNPLKLFTATESAQRPGWPGFLPDSSGVVFQLELAPGEGDERFVTRKGARGELWWVDLEGNAHALDNLNGKGHLPDGPNGHDDDETLQYEPTVAPIVAGGYAWVVFTSRRMYGNIATRDAYESDPREDDLTDGNAKGATTKKLWVAAIDVPAKPGTDPSHPAFYLPAQELFAGNSRGFWVPEACRENGASCESADACCGGFCRELENGIFTCTDELPPAASCSQEFESCETEADCCLSSDEPMQCVGGRCAMLVVY